MIKIIQKIINSILGLLNLKLIKATHVINSNSQGYISAKETVKTLKHRDFQSVIMLKRYGIRLARHKK